MILYYLKWITSSGVRVPKDGAAFTDKERADTYRDLCNTERNWRHRLLGAQWVVGTLNLREGPKEVKDE